MWRSIPITAFVIVLFLVLPCYGEEKEPNLIQRQYPELKEIEFFGDLVVTFRGGDEIKSGLNQKQLTDYLKLKYIKYFSGIPYKKAPEEYLYDYAKRKKVGIIEIIIWTTAKDHHIASYMVMRAGHYNDIDIFKIDMLGIETKESINAKVNDLISELVMVFSVIFFKARGEM